MPGHSVEFPAASNRVLLQARSSGAKKGCKVFFGAILGWPLWALRGSNQPFLSPESDSALCTLTRTLAKKTFSEDRSWPFFYIFIFSIYVLNDFV